MKYQITIIMKPVAGESGDIWTLLVKAGKQRCQNLFKILERIAKGQTRKT